MKIEEAIEQLQEMRDRIEAWNEEHDAFTDVTPGERDLKALGMALKALMFLIEVLDIEEGSE